MNDEDGKIRTSNLVADHKIIALDNFYTEGIAIIDEDGYFQYVTTVVERFLDYKIEELQNLRFTDLLYADHLSRLISIFKNTTTDSKGVLVEFSLYNKNGILQNYKGSLVNKFTDPTINGFVLTFRKEELIQNSEDSDLTISKNLLDNEQFSRTIVSSLTDQIAVLSEDGTIIAVNNAWKNFETNFVVENSNSCSVGSNYFEVCENAIAGGATEVQLTLDGIRSVFNRDAASFRQEYPCVTPTLESWFKLNVLPFGSDRTKVVITHRDITKRKLAEDKLSYTKDKLQNTLSNFSAILNSSLDLICTVNSSMEFEIVNKASLKILGYLPEELIGRKFIDFVFEEDVERTLEGAKNIYRGNPEHFFENRYVQKNGENVSLLWSVNWDETAQLMYCIAKDMTESKDLQKSIEKERDQYNDMFLKAPSAVVMLRGKNHIYEMANPLYLQLVGKTDIIGKTVEEIIPEITEQGFIKVLDSVYETGKSERGTEVLFKLNNLGTGELVDTYLNFLFQAYRNLKGEIEGVFFFANDVTEHILARRMVEKSEKFFKGVTESSQDMLATISESGKILYTSPAVSKTYGFSIDEISTIKISDVIHPDDKLQSKTFLDEVLSQPAIPLTCSAVRQRKKDGSYLWVEVTLTNFLEDEGINAIVANFRDISARKKSESLLRATLKELNEEKARLIAAQKVAKIGSWQTNVLTREASWSEETFRILGADPLVLEASFDAFVSFIHPDDKELVTTNFEKTLKNEGVQSLEHRIITQQGEVKWIEEKWTISTNNNTQDEVAIGTCQDITERHLAAEKISQSETKLKIAQHISHVGSWEINLKTGEHSWSDEFYKILEIDQSITPSSESFYNTIHHEDLEMVISGVDEAANKYEGSAILFRFIKKDGQIGYGCTEWKVDYDYKNRAAHFYGILRDLTAEHKADEERQKMVLDIIRRNKDLEQFSYIISHNLRSPVANIVGLTEELRDESHSPETMTELREAISSDVKRLEDVILDLNTIVQTKRDIVERKENISLSRLVENIMVSINYLIENQNVEVNCNFESVDTIWTIKSYMQSIFYNIISNSIKYRNSDKALVLNIETKLVNKKIHIIFADNGVGIDLDRYSPQIFGLYKRFHSGTEGKGLGLYMVKTQVETLGGTITVKSDVNIGTEFTIEFNQVE